jgi:hypothetical protein
VNSSSPVDAGDVDRGFFVTLGNDVMMQPCLDPETQMPPPNDGSARRAARAHAEPARLSLTPASSLVEREVLKAPGFAPAPAQDVPLAPA